MVRISINKHQLKLLGKVIPCSDKYANGTILWDLTTLYVYCGGCQQRVHLGTYKKGYHTDLRSIRPIINDIIRIHQELCN